MSQQEVSRAASKAALGLPDSHPGYAPLSHEDWRPYQECAAGCGKRVCFHSPSDDEREEQKVVGGVNDPTVGLICSYTCLKRHQPDHPISQNLNMDTYERHVRIAERREAMEAAIAAYEAARNNDNV